MNTAVDMCETLCMSQKKAFIINGFVAYRMGHQFNYTKAMIREFDKKANLTMLAREFMRVFEVDEEEIRISHLVRKSTEILNKYHLIK